MIVQDYNLQVDFQKKVQHEVHLVVAKYHVNEKDMLLVFD
jgi:hypothetical protein